MSSNFLIRIVSFVLILTGLQAGDLKVNLVNGTTNAPGFADRVGIMDLSKGMVELASVKSVNGSTIFTDISSGGQSQYLIQAHLGGVTYSSTIVPSVDASSWEVTVTVYDVKHEVTDVHTTVPFFVIYAFEDRLYIQKRLIFENHSQPPVTFSDSPGVIKVHIPENVTELDYLTYKNGSMPLRTQVINTESGQLIPNSLKPGKSEIDIAYYVPFESSSALLSEIVNYDIEHFHVYVMPLTMQISAPGLSREGTDNENGLAIYAIEGVKAGTSVDFQISGKGMSETEPQQQQQQTKGRIVVEHRQDAGMEYVIAGILIALILFLLFISISQQGENLKQESVDSLKKQKQSLLKEYATLEGSDSQALDQEKVLQRLISIYKTLDRIK